MIGCELHRLTQQHDRSVVIAGGAEIARLGEVLLRDHALRQPLLQFARKLPGSLLQQLVVGLPLHDVFEHGPRFIDAPIDRQNGITDDRRKRAGFVFLLQVLQRG